MSVNLGTAVGYLDLDISKFESAWNKANKEAEEQSKTLGKKFESVGESVFSAGKKMTAAITTPIIGAGTAAVKTTADFDKTMSKVSAISGATGNDLDDLRQKAKEMGAQTKFSASESAEAFTYMAMAGWKTEDMLSGIDGVMALAAADGLDLATTSDIVTDGLTAFGKGAEEASHFADVLAQTGRNANTNVSMLGESFKYVAPVAGALGYSFEDVSVALGLMANSGIKASSGGTALRTMLTNLAKPTDDMAIAMDYLGISLQNDDGSMKSLMDVMKDLRKSFGNVKMPMEEFQKQLGNIQAKYDSGEISEKEYNESLEDLTEKAYGAEGALKAKYAATLAGKTGMAGLLAIVNTGEKDFNDLSNAVYNSKDAAQEMADTMLNNLSGQLTILKSSLEGLAIQIGEILMPHVEKIVKRIQELVEWFSNLSTEQKETILKFAGIVAAIGPALMIFGKLISTIAKVHSMITMVKGALSTLSIAFSSISAPILAIVAIIAVVIAAFTTLWKNNEEFRNKVTAIWDGIKSKFEEFSKAIVDRLNALGFDFNDITEVLKAIWEGFCNLLAPIFEGVFKQISNILSAVLDTIVGILDVFIGLFTGNWEQMWNGVNKIFGAAWNYIKNTFSNLANVLKGILDTILGFFGTSLGELVDKVKNAMLKVKDAVVNGLKSLPDKMKEIGKNIVDGVWKGISGAASALTEKVKNWSKGILNTAKNALDIHSPSGAFEKGVGRWLPPGVGNGFKKAMPALTKRMTKDLNEGLEKVQKNVDELSVAAKYSVSGDKMISQEEAVLNVVGGINYTALAQSVLDILRMTPIKNEIIVDMKDGDVYLDNERIGRKVAPVVSRVVASGIV